MPRLVTERRNGMNGAAIVLIVIGIYLLGAGITAVVAYHKTRSNPIFTDWPLSQCIDESMGMWSAFWPIFWIRMLKKTTRGLPFAEAALDIYLW